MSDYRSFGSNYHPSSQSRKISIGVMADSQPKRNPGPDKADGDVIARVEKLKSAAATDLQSNKKDKGDLSARQRSSAQVTGHVTSPWRSSNRKLGTLENVLCKQTSSFSGSKGVNKELDGVHQAPARESFQDFPISSPQHSHGELNGGRNNKVLDMSPEGMEEPPSAVLQQKVASQREEMEQPGKEKIGSTDALRSKLWEILGKASPANNKDVNSETPEVVKANLKLSQDKGSYDDPLIKPIHNSDSIETDSESPEDAARRPVTRSLLKRVGAKGVQKRTKAGANTGRKTAEQVNNIFSFDEGFRGKAGTAAMNSAVMPKKQRGRRKNTVVQCRKAHSRRKDEVDGIRKEASKSNTPPHSESTETGKRSSFSDKKGSSHELHPQSKAWKHKPDISTKEKDFHPSPEAETAATAKMFQGLSKNGEIQERTSNVFMENSAEPENEFQSPTFGYKAPISSPSPCFSPGVSPLQPRNISPTLDETETPIFSFGTKKTSQGTTGQASDIERRLPDFLEKKRDSSFRRESSPEQNEDLVLSDRSSDEGDSDGSGEDSPVLGHYNSPKERETANWSNEKSKLGSSSAKRNSNFKGTGCVVLSPPTSLSEGIHKTDSFQHCPEMDEDDGLGRAVALFALALQNYEKKLKSAAEKKSSEIIASVSEEIHLELENVKSHIITEAGKTSNLAKTKRKHAETKLQEQQEKMRMIHEKFKDDVSHHLEDFKTTIEGLEANHSELKGSIKKQRTSHQKLIAQFEGGIETKLENATKRIKSVNKSARGKMVQLKMIVAECLKDDVLG
ncbi:meiosis-specific protein ASY3 [Capsella rubella]|uniref:meiosis-specific protein ASY3 n=1 Tax=Capsella rubella TaxID=81985 RepID=UPI000CD4DE8B|nr:meiosis-specific protein ASY3 [Capsella rubella]XP_023640597.1 meiosis-specific protein ASY3 [Capsella rubella]XP_023640598.1 meiosis-specific protein ASY3 [Capsella rubella]XP_023640599.1 meiosis-specific protein ASY3 [Capsella rubella]